MAEKEEPLSLIRAYPLRQIVEELLLASFKKETK